MAKAKDRKTTGKEYLEGILAKIPDEAARKAVEAHLLSDELVTQVGDDVLRQDEFSRQTAALKTATETVNAHKATLDEWYAQKKADLEELDTLRSKRGRQDDDEDPPQVDLSKYVKTEDVAKEIARIQEDGLWLMKTVTKLSMQHLNDFKEVLDTDAVIAHAREKKLTLDLAYADMVKPRVDERTQKETEARIAAAKEEGRLEEARRRETLPYPVGNQEPSTLDGMKEGFDKTSAVQRAVNDHYKSRSGGA